MEILMSDATERFMALGSGVVRTEGVHMTTMIRGVMDRMGISKHAEGWDMNVAAEVGFLWEDIWSRIFAERFVVRLKEQIKDGVMCSPDGIEQDPGWVENGEIIIPPNKDKLVLDEYKCTWRSCKNPPTEDWYWMAQAKGYCKVMETDTVMMRILYLMGNYRGSGPMYREARITFDPVEIDNNWNMILRQKERVEEEMRNGE